MEQDVDISRIRVATGFIFNEKAVRKLVPNKPRWLMSGAGDRRDDPVNKEVQNLCCVFKFIVIMVCGRCRYS